MNNTSYALIAGGSSGIGLAIAKQFVEKGTNVLLLARGTIQLESACTNLNLSKINNSQWVDFFAIDTSDYPIIQEGIRICIAKYGIPYYVINCVGIARPNYFEQITYESFDKVIKTNLYGTWNLIHAVYPYLIQQQQGHIVLLSSVAGYIGVFGYTDYAMTKFGIIGFAESLRYELKPHHIKVQVLCPPDTQTPGLEIENRTKPKETFAIAKNAKLMEADAVAKKLMRQLNSNKFLLFANFDSYSTYLLKRFFPKIVFKIIDSIVQRSRRVG